MPRLAAAGTDQPRKEDQHDDEQPRTSGWIDTARATSLHVFRTPDRPRGIVPRAGAHLRVRGCVLG
jgi:hypothetical protein